MSTRISRNLIYLSLRLLGAASIFLFYSLGWQRRLYKGRVVFTHSNGMHAYGLQAYPPDAKFVGVVAFGIRR